MDSLFFSTLIKTFDLEKKRNEGIEKKAYRFLFLSTILIPLAKWIEDTQDFIFIGVLIFTGISALTFLFIIKLRGFLSPIDTDYYLTKNNEIYNERFDEDTTSKTVDIKIMKKYIRCNSANKKIINKKAKYLQFLYFVTLAQIGFLILFILFSKIQI